MNIYRGDIYYVNTLYPDNIIGSEQKQGRPAIVVSNDMNNTYAETVTVVYLTTQDKKPLPVHVSVICKVPCTALCEQIATISIQRLGDFVRTCTAAEMEAIDKALMVQLGIEMPAALEAELNAEKAFSDKYAKEIASLQVSNDSLKKTLEEYRTMENIEIRKLKDALDAEKENSLLYKAQLDAQTTANEELRKMLAEAETKMDVMTAAREQEAEEREDEQEVVDLTPTEVRMLIETQDENIRLKAEIDVYKTWLGKLIPQLA